MKSLDTSLAKLFEFYGRSWTPEKSPLCTPAESADQLSALRARVKASFESEKAQGHSTIKEQANENASSLRS